MAKTLFVTPDFTSDVWQCRTLETPNNAEWLGVFNKALLLMLDPYNWEQINDTDVSVDDTIAIVNEILIAFWATENCGSCMLPGLGTPPFRLGINGKFEMLDPATGEWGEPTGEYAIPATPPRTEPTVYERRCAAAANAAHVVGLVYEAITDEIALGGDALQVAAAMVAALVTAVGGWIAAPVYAIVQLTIALFAGVVELLQVLGADVWTPEYDDHLKCVLFMCATDEGDVVTFDLDCIRENLYEGLDLLDPDFFYDAQIFAQVLFLLETITMDGLNAAGATTDVATPDCEDCDSWCYTVDLLDNDGGFDPYDAGTWASTVGWQAENVVIGVQRTILQGAFPFSPSITITQVIYNYDYFVGTPQTGVFANAVAINGFTEVIFARNMEHQSDGADQQEIIDGEWSTTSLDFDIQCSHNAYGGSATLKAVTLRGTGDKPTFLEAMGWGEC